MAAKALEKERRPKVTLENLFDTLASESNKVLKVVVKADTQGSVEAIVDALKKIEIGQSVAGNHPQRRGNDHGIRCGPVLGFESDHSRLPYAH